MAAAWEALMGLRMGAGQTQDISSSMSPNDSVDLSIKDEDNSWSDQDHLQFRVNAIKGFVTLLNGETESAQLFFNGWKDCYAGIGNDQAENVVLSYGEYLGCAGDFHWPTQMYDTVLEAVHIENKSRNFIAAANMVPEEVSLGATCSYGQLLSHFGKFGEAQDYLTGTLQKAEEQFVLGMLSLL